MGLPNQKNIMSINEAREYVDTVIEGLVDMGIISAESYGRITEDQQQALAEKIVEKSEE